MGVVRTAESMKAEVEEFRRNLVMSAGIHRRKDDEGRPRSLPAYKEDEDEEGTLVCVTSGVSYLGLALVNQLLIRGYSVRITVENPGMSVFYSILIFFYFVFEFLLKNKTQIIYIKLKMLIGCSF